MDISRNCDKPIAVTIPNCQRDGSGGLVTKLCPTLAIPWTVACQAPLSMGLSRWEYWSELPFPSPGDLPDPGIEPGSSIFQEDSLLNELWGKPDSTFEIPFSTEWGQSPIEINAITWERSVQRDSGTSCDTWGGSCQKSQKPVWRGFHSPETGKCENQKSDYCKRYMHRSALSSTIYNSRTQK